MKLEPLKPEKKAMWKREMKVLLSVCEYIQEFAPTAQYLEDGTIVEVSLLNDNHNFNGTCLASLNLYNIFLCFLSDDEKQAKVRHLHQPPCTAEA